MARYKKHEVALMLSGGGARAAYQVGILKAISTAMFRNETSPFKIICGTSAGAINATALACYASCYHLGVKKLEWVWKNFRTEQVYHSSFTDVFGHILRHSVASFQADYATRTPASLLDNQPLRRLLKQLMDLKRIDRNLVNEHLHALCINASSYSTGESVSFFQSLSHDNWQRVKRRGEKTIINIEHLMASSAIPLVFPTVKIEHGYFGDGSVHQISPLSAPIHLGAEKIVIIGLEPPQDVKYWGYQRHHPSLASVAGHLLDTIFSDTLRADLERMERINSTIAKQEALGIPSDLRPIKTLMLNPSHNFNEIAQHHFERLPRAVRTLLRTIGVKKSSSSSLTSYLLFEREYTSQLIHLGYQDGLARLDEICEFLEL